jgi:hypothetical protein
MVVRLTAPMAIMLTASCAVAAPPKEAKPVQIQFAFFHFKNDQVRVTVNGKTAFNRMVTVAPDNARYGLAAVAQISLPECADIVVTTKRQKVAQRLCISKTTKSIVIDGGPPLTIVAKDQYQGDD